MKILVRDFFDWFTHNRMSKCSDTLAFSDPRGILFSIASIFHDNDVQHFISFTTAIF